MLSQEQLFYEVLKNEDLSEFIAENIYFHRKREVFDTLPAPQSFSHDYLWEIIARLRMLLGVIVNKKLGEPVTETAWYNVTPKMNSDLVSIMHQAGGSSSLSEFLFGHFQKGFTIEPLINEISAGFYRDGIQLDYETIQSFIKGNRKPNSDAEALLANFYELFLDLPILAQQEISVDFMSDLVERLSKGIEEYAPKPYHRPFFVHFPTQVDKGIILDSITRSYTERDNEIIHPLIQIVSNADLFWEFHPLEKWNGLTEILIRDLFALKIGSPALLFVPFSFKNLKWELGEMSRQEAPYPYGGAVLESECGMDVTLYFVQKINFILSGLDQLNRLSIECIEREEKLKGKLSADFRLNHRQAIVVERMIEDMAYETDNQTYCSDFGVVPATARSDLRRLVQLDYVYRSHTMNRVVYKAHPDLSVKIDEFFEKGNL